MSDKNEIKLWELSVGERGEVVRLECKGALRRRLLDMGFSAGTCVEKTGESPSFDPSAYLVKGAVLALRKKDCEGVYLRSLKKGGRGIWE